MRRTLLLALLAACGHPTAPAPPAPPRLRITSTPELVLPGIVSTEATEIRLAISPRGDLMAWGSTNRAGGRGGWDVWLAHKTAAGWSAPEPAPFDSDANDFDPAFSPDGASLYFFSNRAGGSGGDDLYVAPIAPLGGGAATSLAINTPGDEWAPTPSRDGKALLYASNNPARPGKRHDLYTARFDGARLVDPQPLPGAVNTDDDEFDATYLADGASIVFARSTDVETAPVSLYFAARGPDGAYLPAVPLPATVNVGDATLGPSIDPADPYVLYFSGRRPDASAGKLDLYRVRYAL